MNVLLHACCAPCSVACIEALRQEGHALSVYWYNPNIHPFTEYKARRNALRDYAKQLELPMMEADEYGLRRFIAAVHPDYDARCGYCYTVRLEEAARQAADNGFDAFTTSLLISPYQNHELLIETGKAMGEKYGVRFLDRDFRPLFREGQAAAREMGLYMQKYCGCIFSEEERYQKKKRA